MAANSCCVRLLWWTVALFRENPLILPPFVFESQLAVSSVTWLHTVPAKIMLLMPLCYKVPWISWGMCVFKSGHLNPKNCGIPGIADFYHMHTKKTMVAYTAQLTNREPVPFLGCPNEEKKVFRHCIVWAPIWDGLVGGNSHLGRFCVNPCMILLSGSALVCNLLEHCVPYFLVCVSL